MPLAHPQLADSLAHPGRRHRRLVNGVVRRQLDVVKDMVGAVPHRRPAGGLPLRINHVIRAVAQQKFGVDIPCRPGQDEACALLLQQGRGLQRALEVVSNGHHAQVKVPHPQGGDERLAGAVPDLRVGHQVQRVVDPLLVFVHRQHLVVQLLKLGGHVPPEAAQSDQQYRFHPHTSFLKRTAQPTVTRSWGSCAGAAPLSGRTA